MIALEVVRCRVSRVERIAVNQIDSRAAICQVRDYISEVFPYSSRIEVPDCHKDMRKDAGTVVICA
jgi:hypothetical protein